MNEGPSAAFTEDQPSEEVRQHVLKGHRDAVTCLAYSPAGSFLCSGSADKSVRLWDIRTQKAALCILLPGETTSSMEIASVAFHPDHEFSDPQSAYDHNILISTNQAQLLEYDLRYIRKAHDQKTPSLPLRLIIRDKPTMDYTKILSSCDEVNQIAVFATQHHNTFIATADDNGDVRVVQTTTTVASKQLGEPIDIKTTPPQKTTKTSETQVFRHNDMALVTSVAFRPAVANNVRKNKAQRQGRALLLASGGTDCTVKLWDVHTSALLASYLVPTDVSSSGVNQICNPPMVHSISWSTSGKFLATALGDGSCLIFRVVEENKNTTNNNINKRQQSILLPHTRLTGAHSSATASVHFPHMIHNGTQNLSYGEDRLLLTAGNDGNILFWDIGWDNSNTTLTGLLARQSKQPFPSNTGNHHKLGFNNNKKKGKQNKKHASDRKHTNNSEAKGEANILLGIPHAKKPNCITTNPFGANSTCIGPFSIFVADTTNDITVYTIPFQ
mmetsp:Transcript_20811/g.29677  ORF Transcript_20811/g.29677 Transcript_20811/m.29677 type:complete len:500 (-) Transcript_20811:636-2135(-)